MKLQGRRHRGLASPRHRRGQDGRETCKEQGEKSKGNKDTGYSSCRQNPGTQDKSLDCSIYGGDYGATQSHCACPNTSYSSHSSYTLGAYAFLAIQSANRARFAAKFSINCISYIRTADKPSTRTGIACFYCIACIIPAYRGNVHSDFWNCWYCFSFIPAETGCCTCADFTFIYDYCTSCTAYFFCFLSCFGFVFGGRSSR